MQIKIFAEEKPVYIADKMTEHLKDLSEQKQVIFFDDHEKTDALALIKELSDAGFTAAVILAKDPETVKKDFFAQFEVIEAAGGIVQNEKKDILFIFRRGKWDLPKGKMEKEEQQETCAEREIEEETGVTGLTLKRKVGETYHIYTEKGKDILKISHWFYFTCASKQDMKPQTEEDITEVKWIPTQKIKEPMANTYKSIREIMTEFFDTP